MSRGRQTCILKVEYKQKDKEDGFIPPDEYNKTFEELSICSGAKLVIIEMKRMGKYELESAEGQESEMEEMEDEIEEGDAEKAAGAQDEEGDQKAFGDSIIQDVNEADKAQLSGAPQDQGGNPSSAPAVIGDLQQQAVTGPGVGTVSGQGQSHPYFS